MGKRIKSLMQAAEAAGYAMAPDDIYAAEDIFEHHVILEPSKSTALVPYVAATPSSTFLNQARALAARYSTAAWLAPRLPA